MSGKFKGLHQGLGLIDIGSTVNPLCDVREPGSALLLRYTPVILGPVRASASSPAPKSNSVPTSGIAELASTNASIIKVVLAHNLITWVGYLDLGISIPSKPISSSRMVPGSGTVAICQMLPPSPT